MIGYSFCIRVSEMVLSRIFEPGWSGIELPDGHWGENKCRLWVLLPIVPWETFFDLISGVFIWFSAVSCRWQGESFLSDTCRVSSLSSSAPGERISNSLSSSQGIMFPVGWCVMRIPSDDWEQPGVGTIECWDASSRTRVVCGFRFKVVIWELCLSQWFDLHV